MLAVVLAVVVAAFVFVALSFIMPVVDRHAFARRISAGARRSCRLLVRSCCSCTFNLTRVVLGVLAVLLVALLVEVSVVLPFVLVGVVLPFVLSVARACVVALLAPPFLCLPHPVAVFVTPSPIPWPCSFAVPSVPFPLSWLCLRHCSLPPIS